MKKIHQKLLEKLAFINQYYSTRRGVGHTREAMSGLDRGLYVVMEHNHKIYVPPQYRHRMITWGQIPYKLAGSFPLIIDHYVWQHIITNVFQIYDGMQLEIELANGEKKAAEYLLRKSQDEIKKLRERERKITKLFQDYQLEIRNNTNGPREKANFTKANDIFDEFERMTNGRE